MTWLPEIGICPPTIKKRTENKNYISTRTKETAMSEHYLQNAETFQVLIVDDIPENLQILSNILFEKGIEISFATNGKQALETVEYNPPDLILLDISMPEMDGYEVCERLKKDPKTKEIPVIFLTARTQTDDIIKGFNIGAVDYVTKPFNASELVSRVFTHLDLKRSKDIIANQNSELQELNATKDKFFSIVAHDLKNPFNTLIGFSELLIKHYKKMDTEKVKRFHNLMHKASKHGYTLLENLLQWARSQTGRLKWQPGFFGLKTVAQSTIDLLSSNAQNKEVTLTSDIDPKYNVFADQNMVTTILRNLVSNAIKFTNRGGTVTVIAEDYEPDQDNNNREIPYVKITVSDTGIGIPESDINKLFRIDVHHSTQGTEEEQGTGLGLILCKEFVEKHTGKIWVTSKVNEGTDFIFTLPLSDITQANKKNQNKEI